MPVHLRYRVPDVSIHLMLLFIMSDEEIKKQYTEFQYISCYSLSQMKQSDASAFVEFQYISCYSLSFQATPLAFHHLCFNTSHVTLYPDVLSLMLSQCSFQYISCYSLSELPPHLWRVLVPFQYISCYSLSPRKAVTSIRWEQFQYISCYSLSDYYEDYQRNPK